MKLTPGELYFIRERDKQTKEVSRYVKIGLVKEKDDRASHERALEHQTGNPRELLIHAVIKTPAISEIENIVHGLFATERVSGEWFDFTDAKLNEAIATAKDLAEEAQLYEKEILAVAALAKETSNDVLLNPSKEALAWHGAFLRAEAISKYCQEFADSMIEVFRQKAEEEPDEVENFVTYRERKDRKVFDPEAFQNRYPDLFIQFTKTTTRIAPRLTWTRPKDFNNAIENLNPELFKYGKTIAPIIEKARAGKVDSETVHKHYLRVLGFQARAGWQLEIAKANVQYICGKNAGIQGICKWSRVEKVTKTFDQPAFIEAFPDIAEEFMSIQSQTSAFIVDPKQGY